MGASTVKKPDDVNAKSASIQSPKNYASFDCARAHAPDEELICSDPELGAADTRLGNAYQERLARDPADKDKITREQQLWISNRNSDCGVNARTVIDGPQHARYVACFLQQETEREKELVQQVALTRSQAEGSQESFVAAPQSASKPPQITSVSAIGATPAQEITIIGTGFGSSSPCDGDTSFFRVHDSWGWNAGFNQRGRGCQSTAGGDQVTVKIAQWSDSKIVLEGFGGLYGAAFWKLRVGDQVSIQLKNPQNGLPSNGFATTVSAFGQPSGPEPLSSGGVEAPPPVPSKNDLPKWTTLPNEAPDSAKADNTQATINLFDDPVSSH